MSAQEILIESTLVLAEQHCCNKKSSGGRMPTKQCFKGLAQDITEYTNPDLIIMAEIKDKRTLAMGLYVWTKVSTQT